MDGKPRMPVLFPLPLVLVPGAWWLIVDVVRVQWPMQLPERIHVEDPAWPHLERVYEVHTHTRTRARFHSHADLACACTVVMLFDNVLFTSCSLGHGQRKGQRTATSYPCPRPCQLFVLLSRCCLRVVFGWSIRILTICVVVVVRLICRLFHK